jgi:divalent metal cation (Fe/Co/Zn/Cd) transporter
MVDPGHAPPTSGPTTEDVRAGWQISRQSILWTIVASTVAVAIGVISGSGALVAFGVIGFVDAMGSSALVYHFGHALRHEQISLRGEKVAHRIVIVGLIAVGLATVVINATRLAVGVEVNASVVGIGLAAVSVPVLTVLAIRKRVIARRVSSAALRADGHLSAVGAALATITLAGTAASEAFGWQWADAIAAIAVGCIAAFVGIQSWLTELPRRRLRGIF